MLSEEIEKRKRIRMKKIANYFMQTAIDQVIWNKYNELFQKLRPYFDCFLARQKHKNIYQQAKREKYLKNKMKGNIDWGLER